VTTDAARRDEDPGPAEALVILVRARHVYRAPTAPTSLFASRAEVIPSAFAEAINQVLPPATMDESVIWQIQTLRSDPLETLTAAVNAQLAGRNAPRILSDSGTPAFQAVVLVGTSREMEDPDAAWAAASASASAAGGQIIVTAAAARRMEDLQVARFYQWEPRGRGREYFECIYDDRLTLLDPPFERMFASEIEEWVLPRRKAQSGQGYGRPAIVSPTRPTVENDLYGIALSGGGMRSATFSLGVLQALSRHDMLEPADFLATVSGGGYVGVSFAGLCAEELPYQGLSRLGASYDRFPYTYPRGRLDDPHFPSDNASSAPIHGNETPATWHVRKYANLLGGGIGLFNLLTWQTIGRYLVSTVALWLLFLVPVLGIAVVAGAGIAYWAWNVIPTLATTADRPWLAPTLALTPALLILWMAIVRAILGRGRVALVSELPFPPRPTRRRTAFVVLVLIGATAVVMLVASGIATVLQPVADQIYPDLEPIADALWLRPLVAMAVPAIIFGIFVTLGLSTVSLEPRQMGTALLFLFILMVFMLALYLQGGPAGWLTGAFAVGLVAAGLAAATVIRTSGPVWAPRMLRGLAGIAATLLITLIIGGAVWLYVAGRPLLGLDAEGTREALRRILMVASAVSSILVAFGLPRVSSAGGGGFIARLAFAIGGYVVLLSLGIVAAWASWVLFARTDNDWIGLALVVFFIITLGFPVAMDSSRATLLNALSLSGVYEDRLQQTWIIGARPVRADAPEAADHLSDTVARWHSVWPRPDLTVAQLRGIGAPTVPYPLICATLNIPGSRGDKLPERKADSFVIAPLYSGSAMSRWSPSAALDGFGDMTLARAVSISGAAVAPNMGEKTSRTLSVITTLFNVRIGRWMRNPRQATGRGWLLRGLNALPAMLYVRELLGIANREDEFVYLSDGGHFDNLGVYELFRRRCRYIVAVSADTLGQGGADTMGNLGTALRMARVDFGVEVEIPSLKPLMRIPEDGSILSYFAVGTIRYPGTAAAGAAPVLGTFVLIKTGLVAESLTADLIQYLAGNPSFPYDSTLDQQYDQPQFESYRQLGYLAARTMCAKASAWPEQAGPPPEGWPQPLAARFEALRHEFEQAPDPMGSINQTLAGIREELARTGRNSRAAADPEKQTGSRL
jgi:hypothetical protein